MTTPTPPERAGAPTPPSAAPSPHADPPTSGQFATAQRRAKRPKRLKLTLYLADQWLMDAINAKAEAQDRSVSWTVVDILTHAMQPQPDLHEGPVTRAVKEARHQRAMEEARRQHFHDDLLQAPAPMMPQEGEA